MSLEDSCEGTIPFSELEEIFFQNFVEHAKGRFARCNTLFDTHFAEVFKAYQSAKANSFNLTSAYSELEKRYDQMPRDLVRIPTRVEKLGLFLFIDFMEIKRKKGSDDKMSIPKRMLSRLDKAIKNGEFADW